MNITIEYIYELFQQQEGKCALSGLPIFLPIKSLGKKTASLDRIDSSKGYIVGNVQWVHKIANKIKWNLDEKTFFEFCKTITEYQESKTKS